MPRTGHPQITVRFTPDELARLDRDAEAAGQTRAALIRTRALAVCHVPTRSSATPAKRESDTVEAPGIAVALRPEPRRRPAPKLVGGSDDLGPGRCRGCGARLPGIHQKWCPTPTARR
jgi:hypothetical protein